METCYCRSFPECVHTWRWFKQNHQIIGEIIPQLVGISTTLQGRPVPRHSWPTQNKQRRVVGFLFCFLGLAPQAAAGAHLSVHAPPHPRSFWAYFNCFGRLFKSLDLYLSLVSLKWYLIDFPCAFISSDIQRERKKIFVSEKYLSYNSRCVLSQKLLGLELNYTVLIKEVALSLQSINNTRCHLHH